VVEDFDKLRETPNAWQNHTVAVCALGTTRSTAGGAEGFIKVDRDYVVAAAELAKAAGIERFSLLTASSSSGVPSWIPRSVVSAIHPLLYTQTKHEAEVAVLGAGFKHVSIFRPGLLDRCVHQLLASGAF
jgi:oxidoreductase